MKNFSVVIPVYNEEKLLTKQVTRIIEKIKYFRLPVKFEILLIENGSTDNTCKIANSLTKQYHEVKKYCLPIPSYGQAFKEGLRQAKYPYIFQFDIDFWDINFILKAQKLLSDNEIIIGSKNMNGAHDLRPIFRKLSSRIIEKIINLKFKVNISDTHGLKAIRKEIADRFTDQVVCSNHFFDSELIIRAVNSGFKVAEIPVSLKELRSSRFPFVVRIFDVLKELFTLFTLNLKEEFQYRPYAYRIQKAVVKYVMQLFI